MVDDRPLVMMSTDFFPLFPLFSFSNVQPPRTFIAVAGHWRLQARSQQEGAHDSIRTAIRIPQKNIKKQKLQKYRRTFTQNAIETVEASSLKGASPPPSLRLLFCTAALPVPLVMFNNSCAAQYQFCDSDTELTFQLLL